MTRTVREHPLTTRIAATLLVGQAVLIEAAMIAIVVEGADASVLAGALMVIGITTFSIVVLYGLATWRLLSGSRGGRIFCTIVSAGSFIVWLPQVGLAPKCIALLAVMTIVVTWLPRTSAQSSVSLTSVKTPR